MVLAMQQSAAYRTALALWSVLCALACGGKVSDLTDGVESQGGNTATGWTSIATGSAMMMTMAGTQGYTVSANGGAIAQATGGAPSATTTVGDGCRGLTTPTAPGSFSITSGYVTTGLLRGYGFTWIGDQSNANTCIVPVCSVTGCTPAFGATALCAAGAVAADMSYNSIVGLGFNLNQASSGSPAESISAPATLTVDATFYGTTYPFIENQGNAAARIQIVDDAANNYCVAAGAWTSGSPIDITTFNTMCWDGTGVPLITGTPIVSIHLIVPSDSTTGRAFSFCWTGVTLN